jgi:UDP-N-acetyl-D-glucosamine dehydrogenase
VELTKATLSEADVVVIVTDHRAVDYQLVVDHAALVVDSRNATASTIPSRATVVALSGGSPAVGGRREAAATAM